MVEKLLGILVAVFMILSFSMVGFASDQNMVGSSSNWKQLDRIANTEYAGIGAATKIGLTTCGAGEVYTGEVASVDRAVQSIVVNGFEGDKTINVSEAGMNGMPEINHFVYVKYAKTNGERIACSVSTVPKKVAWRDMEDELE
jgi:hypothetical protein